MGFQLPPVSSPPALSGQGPLSYTLIKKFAKQKRTEELPRCQGPHKNNITLHLKENGMLIAHGIKDKWKNTQKPYKLATAFGKRTPIYRLDWCGSVD